MQAKNYGHCVLISHMLYSLHRPRAALNEEISFILVWVFVVLLIEQRLIRAASMGGLTKRLR